MLGGAECTFALSDETKLSINWTSSIGSSSKSTEARVISMLSSPSLCSALSKASGFSGSVGRTLAFSPLDVSLWKDVVFFGGSFSSALESACAGGRREVVDRAEEFFLGGFEAIVATRSCTGLVPQLIARKEDSFGVEGPTIAG
jgi:hypothetical protein